MTIPFFQPDIGDDEIAAVTSCLRSGWLTTGSKVQEFEQAFKSVVKSEYALAVNSCTAALHLALEALGLTPGQKVLVPTMTFAATAEVVLQLGGEPVLVDCEQDTLNIDLSDAEKKVRQSLEANPDQRVVGIMVVHYGGAMVDMDAVTRLAEKYSLWVVEDAAHAFPASYKSREQGKVLQCGEGTSDVTCFSFYANKTITTGEGGMAVTQSKKLYERMKAMSLHGLSRDAWKRYSGGSWDYQITAAGYKYNLTDIAAAIGVEQLKKAFQLQAQRQKIAESYMQGFKETCLELPSSSRSGMHSWHLFPIRLPLDGVLKRNEIIAKLAENGIGTSVHWRPLHEHKFYKDRTLGKCADCPVATKEWHRLISLPIFPGMTESDVAAVINSVNFNLVDVLN